MSVAKTTIVAISTPPGIGGIGIIRLSGPAAKIIVETLAKKKLRKARFAYRVTLTNPDNGQPLDDALLLYFPGPNSYTGEDIVECHVHGNPVILTSIITACLQLGASHAKAGEFTSRAFLNGKLDLTQAEAVADLIHAQSEQGQRVALSHLKGYLFQQLSKHRRQLRELLEHIEGALDFPDEIPAPDKKTVLSDLTHLTATLEKLINTQDYGQIIRDGVTCAIIGKPNAGKSSLLNQLLGEKRAIVSPIPGTTRDFIEAKIQLGGIVFHLIDTAGVRDKAIDPIELLGIKKVRQVIRSAQALIWVVDGSQKHHQDDEKLLSSLPKNTPVYLVLNKSDKKRRFTLENTKRIHATIALSAKSGQGLAQLREKLSEDFSQTLTRDHDNLLCNSRQIACLKESHNALKTIIKTIKNGFEFDAISYDMKTAILHLGEASGEDVTEEILDGIFDRFCVGK
jgi:tRNA modification GTPase